MANEIQQDASRIAAVLNDLFENDYRSALSPEELGQRIGLEESRLRRALTLLEGGGWVERWAESHDGYDVRLSLYGKEQYDEQAGGTKNERTRDSILKEMAALYEEKPNDFTDSEDLVERLGLTPNAACFNLLIMKQNGLLETRELMGTGHEMLARLTARGKALYDNPPKHVLFLSHAAVDRAIALRLRQEIERCFPEITVFVSSAPDTLMVGDPWVEKILASLSDARAALILTTVRGLSRLWVWFEAGAVWGRELPMMSGCLGEKRKGDLPAPFGMYQAANLDDPNDLKGLFLSVEQAFAMTSAAVDFTELAEELKRLEGEAQRIQRAMASPEYPAQRKMIDDTLSRLDETQREALRIVLLQGEVTDRFVVDNLTARGLLPQKIANILPAMEMNTGLVQEVLGTGDFAQRYRINPELKDLLSERLFAKTQSIGS
jgi:DNA-binding MarR family transcriptional regulator